MPPPCALPRVGKRTYDPNKKNHDVDKTTFASVIGAANRVQMCRWQGVGQLQGWISNRANEFRDTVTRSTPSRPM